MVMGWDKDSSGYSSQQGNISLDGLVWNSNLPLLIDCDVGKFWLIFVAYIRI